VVVLAIGIPCLQKGLIEMKVVTSKSKNSESFYICKSFRDKKTGKATSKIVEKLGTREELEKKLGADVDVVLWARARAREMTEEEKSNKRKISVSYDPTKQIELDKKTTFNGGYLFLQQIYHELALDDICTDISSRHHFDYDLDTILSRLVYGRILHPVSKQATYEFSKGLIERPAFDVHQIYRSLGVLSEERDYIQGALYKNSAKVIARKTKILYFDCTNYYFEINEEDDFRRFGHSKQHQPRPLVSMGLFMDAEGIPLAFCMNHGAANEQPTLIPLEEKLIADFDLSKFVVCTDAGLSSLPNRMFNAMKDRQFITTQSVKKLKSHLRSWAVDTSGWHITGSDREFDLGEIKTTLGADEVDETYRKAIYSHTFYKSRPIKEKNPATGEYFEQNLIVTYSFKYRDYQRNIRAGQIDRALRAIKDGSSRLEKKTPNDFRRLIKKTAVTANGEIAENAVYDIDEEIIAKEALFDGYYALCTSLDNSDVAGLLAVNKRRWEIEECFRIMKSEFRARPVYLSREDRIKAHFLTCFVALLIYRILEKKLEEQYTCSQIIDTLKGMEFEEIRGEGFRPLYERTAITDALHAAFGFRTDYEIIGNRDMKKIFKKTKSR
jgi:transposase